MRKIFYLLLVFMLVLFACSAGCTSSTTKKEVLTQEEFQEVMDARAATSAPTTVSTPTSTPVPTQTPLASGFKYSTGDVIALYSDGYTGWVILDYRSSTDEYCIRIISRDSIYGPWIEVDDRYPPVWHDRSDANERFEYHVGHVDVPNSWRMTPTPTATPVPTISYQDEELTSAVTSSRVSVGLLLMAVSRDYDQGDYYSMKSDGEKLEQTAQADYNKISKYRVSSDSQRLKTSYLSALNNAKNIGKYYKMAASEYIKGNDDKGDDYLDTAIWDYNPKYMVDLGVVIQEMGR
jgi:hypothetical protein